MVILGLLLVAGSAVLTTAVMLSNTGVVEVHLWGLSVSGSSLGAVFAAGAITGAAGLFGLFLLATGVRRNRRRRRERRALARDHRRLAERADAEARPADTGGGAAQPDDGTASATGAYAMPDASSASRAPAATGGDGRVSIPSGRSRARHRLFADTDPTRRGIPV